VLETLLFADEVRDPVEEIDVLPVEATFEKRETEMAKLLIDSMTTAWEPKTYRDTYRERVEDLIDQKRQGAVVVTDGPRAEPAPVVDLLAALQASVSAAKGRSDAAPAAAPSRVSEKPAKKPAARRPRAEASKEAPAASSSRRRKAS
jgi:DNA end-binding protein Ku